MSCGLAVLLDDLKDEAVMIFHSDRSQECSDGAGGTALSADHLTHVGGSNPEAQHGAFRLLD